MSLILYMLPTEMLEKILKLLKLKEICQAQLVCKRWNDIIVKGNLVKKVAGKSLNNAFLLFNIETWNSYDTMFESIYKF